MLYWEVAIVVALIFVNGFLAMSELAVVSSRLSRLKHLAQQGAYGAQRALALASNPSRFLSAVQIGITLVGVLSGAFSSATLGLRLSVWIEGLGVANDLAEAIGVGAVVAAITYFSLIVGELVPKQIALRDPETIALRVAPAMTVIAKVAAPLVWILDLSGSAVLRLLGKPAAPGEKITQEEIKALVAEAESGGVLDADERRMITGVMRLGERPVKGVMTPRAHVEWIDATAQDEALRARLIGTQHSRLPVGKSIDELTGVVQTRELLSSVLAGKALDIQTHIRSAPVVPATADALDVLATLRSAPVPMALVYDEYGHLEGIVTPADILETIAGAFRADTGESETPAMQRGDGSWLLSGSLPADEMADHLGIDLPEQREYQTVGGFVLSELQRLPDVGETLNAFGWRFEVVDLDGRRIDKVLASRVPSARRSITSA